MGLIESLKASAIRTADALNRLNDPFPPFDRPALPKQVKKLWDLEGEFYSDLVNNFWVCDGQVLASRLPLPMGPEDLDLGDQAIWHGIYTAMLAMRWKAQTDSEVVSASPTFGELIQAVKGLQLHQTVHGEAAPRLIRGVSNDLKRWQDDASNDTATGHLFGIYAAWKWGPATLQPVCVELALGLASELLGHDHALVGPNGQATTYGALVQGWKTDPLRLTLALAVYAVAATLTGQPAFMKAYSDLYTKYRALIAYPKVKIWWIDNQNDTHRAAIHLAILADLTANEPQALYRSGLWRILQMTRKLGNVWVEALVDWGCETMRDPAHRLTALKVLSEFTLADKQFNPGRDMSVDLRPSAYPWYKRVLWNGTYMANQPLPRWMVRAQDFFWQRNLRSLDVGSAGQQADSRLNGGDFLAAYWLSRVSGVLNADD